MSCIPVRYLNAMFISIHFCFNILNYILLLVARALVHRDSVVNNDSRIMTQAKMKSIIMTFVVVSGEFPMVVLVEFFSRFFFFYKLSIPLWICHFCCVIRFVFHKTYTSRTNAR